jgi:hypothetical protein
LYSLEDEDEHPLAEDESDKSSGAHEIRDEARDETFASKLSASWRVRGTGLSTELALITPMFALRAALEGAFGRASLSATCGLGRIASWCVDETRFDGERIGDGDREGVERGFRLPLAAFRVEPAARLVDLVEGLVCTSVASALLLPEVLACFREGERCSRRAGFLPMAFERICGCVSTGVSTSDDHRVDREDNLSIPHSNLSW